MAAGTLQRSSTSFRRQGSSGLVWNDFLSRDLNKMRHNNKEDFNKENCIEYKDLRQSRSVGSIGLMERRGAFTGAIECRKVKVDPPPTIDPPSPKVAGCGLCGIFGKPTIVSQPKLSNNMYRSK